MCQLMTQSADRVIQKIVRKKQAMLHRDFTVLFFFTKIILISSDKHSKILQKKVDQRTETLSKHKFCTSLTNLQREKENEKRKW